MQEIGEFSTKKNWHKHIQHNYNKHTLIFFDIQKTTEDFRIP